MNLRSLVISPVCAVAISKNASQLINQEFDAELSRGTRPRADEKACGNSTTCN